MRKVFLLVLVFISVQVFGQNPTNYLYRASRERTISQMVDSMFRIPRYNGTPSGLRTSEVAIDGAIAMDTTNNRLYIYNNGAWTRMASYTDATGGAAYSLSSDSLTGWALSFDRTKGHNVYHGLMWPVTDSLRDFFYEAIVRPKSNAEYIISDGYGGQHSLLWGFSGGTSKTLMTGNVYNGSTTISFGSYDSITLNTDHHVAVGYDGSNIVTYLDGVPCGITAFTGYRKTSDGSNGALFVGGSDHSNYNGYIYRIRGFEFGLPIENGKIFYPERVFRSAYPYVVFNADYTTPSNLINDQSGGFLGIKHDGLLNKGAYVESFGSYQLGKSDYPTWVKATITNETYTGAAPTIPGGVKIYDSFKRTDITPWNTAYVTAPKLDTTEGGTLGRLAYISPYGSSCGIISQRAWFGITTSTVYTEVSSSDQDVRVTVDPLAYNNIIVRGRYTDASNYVELYNSTAAGYFYLVKVVAGVTTLINSFTYTPPFTQVKLVITGSTADVILDGTTKLSGQSISGVPLGTKSGFGANSPLSRISKYEVY